MNDREFNNTFRFSLYQDTVLLGERVFSADDFNPITRNFIDIKVILPRIIRNLQKSLSKRNYDTTLKYGDKIDLYLYHKNQISSYPMNVQDTLRYNPQPIIQHIEDKVIRGVECKIGFYINNKPIVERLFYVDGFNIIARWSVDLISEIIYSTHIIKEHIKKSDVVNMWDDYDLINHLGLTINQIRELSQQKRNELLDKIKR